MTKKTFLVSLLAMISVATFAQTPASKIKDVRTKPELYFLQDGQQASSLSFFTMKHNIIGERCNAKLHAVTKQQLMLE